MEKAILLVPLFGTNLKSKGLRDYSLDGGVGVTKDYPIVGQMRFNLFF
jgi:hypothetical protein